MNAPASELELPLLCVVHVADDFVVIDKPAGALSVPGRGEDKRDSIATRVAIAFPDATGPLSVHRLDMETSGLIVVGLNADAHRSLSHQFSRRTVGKRYVALVDGVVEGNDQGEIDLPLAADWPNRPRQIVDPVNGKPARTQYRVIHRDETRRRTRIEFRTLTGRTHQLRVHAATPRERGGLGCPILGDSLYGDPATAPRLMLHAAMLAFDDPATGNRVEFESPAPL